MAGRKRKQGRRTKSGQLSRAGVVLTYDRGTERAQAMQALYGPDGADAIGRAYRSGLLGEGHDAKALLDIGRKIARAYWQAYETGPIRCTLADKNFGAAVAIDHKAAKEREQALEANLKCVQALGQPTRRAFDQLVIDVNPDHGPAWLDRLCWQTQKQLDIHPADLAQLALAIEGLQACK